MKLCVLTLFVIMVMTACTPATLETATPASPTPSIRPSPSATQQPLETQTVIPSFTPTSGASPLLPVLEANCFNDYPAPIELPSRDVKSYQLKSWNVEEAFRLIRIIDENSPPCNQNWTGAMPVYSAQNARRRAAQLAVKEAILRYPDTPDRDLLDWRAAVNNALLNNSSSDDWLIAQLAQAIHEGRATPETLANFVQLYSFEILQVEMAPNLFGDGGTGYVYWLSAHAGSSDGLYFTLREDRNKTYTLYPLAGAWALTWSADGSFSIADHTKDGVPEIAIYRAYRNGSFCWDQLNVYQWNKDRFEDLTVQGIESGDEGCATQFDKPNSEGLDTILSVRFDAGIGYWDVYEWNGRFYERADRTLPHQANADWGLKSQIDILIREEKFLEAKSLINQSIAGIQTIYVSPELKYNFLDYLRFQLAWVNAMEMDVTGAKEKFTALANSPTEPANTIVSRAAQDFLTNYSTQNDLYRACLAANRHMSQQTDSSICDLSAALLSLSEGWTAEQYTDPLATLEEHGVEIRSSLRDDLDGDGTEDWMLAVQTPSRDLVDLYLLRAAGDDSSLAYLAETSPGSFQGSAIQLPGSGRPSVFLQSGRSAYIFQVVPGKLRLNVYLIQTFQDVQNLELPQEVQEALEFKVTYFPGEYTPDWETYRWDKAFQRFTMTENHKSLAQMQWEGPTEAARQAEAKLLIQGKPLEAIQYLKMVLVTPKDDFEDGCWMDYCVDRSRLRYLLALSYELTGDKAHALETYWKLWHDDPGSAYAVLARAKLEPIP